jgi:3',5'-cyclic AMP phosphodiesterase CpdA
VLLLHGSDLQIGKPYRPHAAEAFLELARTLEPDLVVVSGDLTQRAKAREYRTARVFLDALRRTAPVVATPGNHDVPLYRVWERLFSPYRNWRRFIAPRLDSVVRAGSATVVALNSSAPRRAIVGGRLDPEQLDLARRAFASAPPGDARILVVHHHFVPTPLGDGGSPLPGAQALLEAFEAMGVDLILGGHVHQTHITTSRALVAGEGPGIPIVACGTTASSRGRGPEAGRNTLDVVRLESAAVEVVPHEFDRESGRFVPGEPRTFPRAGAVVGPEGRRT